MDKGQELEFIQERIGAVIEGGFKSTPEGLMEVLEHIVAEVVGANLNLKITNFIGVVFFIDRVVIHDSVFARFLGVHPSIIRKVLDHFCFGRMPLQQVYFEALIKYAGIKGSRFDWHTYCYPETESFTEMVQNLYKCKCESYVMALELSMSWITDKKLTISKTEKISIPPKTDIKHLKYSDKTVEEVMQIFANDTNIDRNGKSWLLYMKD